MKKNQTIPWLRIGAESVAVVASILLAFAIDAWWDLRSNQLRTEQLLAALEEEWDGELAEIDYVLADADRATAALDAAYAVYVGDDPEPTPEAAAQTMLAMSPRVYKPSTGALTNVLLNGLREIHDAELRRAIASWQGALNEIAPEQSAILQNGLLDFYRAQARVYVTQRARDVGSPSGELALAIFRDEDFAVVAIHSRALISQYVRQLNETRGQLVENLERLQAR